MHASVVFPVSTVTEFREAMQRNFGQSVEGLGPRQTADDVANAVARCIASAGRRGLPVSPGLVAGALATVIAPAWTDRFVQRFDRRRRAT